MHYTLMVEGINWFECTSADPLEVFRSSTKQISSVGNISNRELPSCLILNQNSMQPQWVEYSNIREYRN